MRILRPEFFLLLFAFSSVASTPKRVVPLEPSLAELATRVGVSTDEIVGVTAFTDFPPALKSKPTIGSYAKPNLEAIVALRPDLVLASRDGTPKDLVERLGKLGISVVTVSTDTLAGLRSAYGAIGKAVGREDAAKSALAEFDHAMETIRVRAKTRAPVKVLLQVGEDPLVVAAGKTFLNEGLVAIGATNLYADPERTYPRVSVEDVLQKNPDVIVLVEMGGDTTQFDRAEKRWRSFPKLSATQSNRIIRLRSDELVRPGPRFPAGLASLERAVYGGK